MATNGILDITTEEYMGQDPEMQIDQDEMIEIIRTLQVIGIPQDKHPEVLEAFKEWKQTNAGTVDMFLEASLQLEPGTITKIKEQQVARGPEDMQTEDEMIIQPGSGDMQEIMQSVGAPQRAAQGGRIGFANGSRDPKNMTTKELIAVVQEGYSTPEIFIELEKRIPGAIEQIKLEEGQGDQAFSINEEILSNYDPDKRAVEEDFLYDLRENIDPNYQEPMEHLPLMAKGGRIKKAPGGIMNLGGLEKDYRTTGGFVPIGAYEKKDDVPARLSKNEFVMTADAVRAAGGGSINRGAQRMYNTMKHLEASPGSKRMTA